MNRVNHRVRSGKITLHAVTDGNPENEPLVLVHGYPDNLHVWDRVVAELARDFYLVRYDVRGAGLSDKPRWTRDYRLSDLAGDLEAVVDQLLPERAFHLAAHDWGSIQSWESVAAGPLQGRILSYSSISGPCLDHVGYWLREQATDLRGGGTARVFRQLASSWYVFLFQVPVLPETLWRLGLDRLWPGILKRYEGVADARFSELQKGDGRFGVKLYRANFLPRLLRPAARYAQCPVQLIIPKGDNYVGAQLFDGQARWTGKLTRREVDAPHWAPLTAPGLVADAIREFAGVRGA
ncbi:alpha/beta fold hydrolase [Marinobacter pelagius]|uniref:alpha/beta fold hydrolase n=1 Tax=Marinobacter sp. C7 TaxID=2951363 RepID=UPI001EEFC8C0|nr:alpha/beta fold hydrolase [Marinobacter sp. C7]MCG7198239.1 alpha/beta fold hydrolase [Marinobacter sp. C7]